MQHQTNNFCRYFWPYSLLFTPKTARHRGECIAPPRWLIAVTAVTYSRHRGGVNIYLSFASNILSSMSSWASRRISRRDLARSIARFFTAFRMTESIRELKYCRFYLRNLRYLPLPNPTFPFSNRPSITSNHSTPHCHCHPKNKLFSPETAFLGWKSYWREEIGATFGPLVLRFAIAFCQLPFQRTFQRKRTICLRDSIIISTFAPQCRFSPGRPTPKTRHNKLYDNTLQHHDTMKKT